MKTTGGFAAIGAAVLLASAGVAAAAGGWSPYYNARYGYTIDIPPGFSAVKEADNSDGGASSATQGHAELSVWGANLAGSFRADARDRIQDDTNMGWKISYKQVSEKAATWSGSKGGRILYVRSIPSCRDQAVYFQLEYDQTTLAAYDAVIKRLAKSLKPRSCP